jgi:core-2/I-Branching enzyme
MNLAFIILNYQNPGQLLRLGRVLRHGFPSADIFCNNDFGQCPLDERPFDGVMSFLKPHQPMRWGHISCVEALWRCLDVLYSGSEGPDWFFLLSGATYPIKSPQAFHARLASAACDAFMDMHPLENLPSADPFVQQVRWRYLRARCLVPALDSTGHWRRSVRVLPPFPFLKWVLPFGKSFRCHVGGFWFAGNRRVAAVLQRARQAWPQAYHHYRLTPVPEESYLQSVVGSSPGLRWQADDLTYVRWPARSKHPVLLTRLDYEALAASDDLLARKIIEGRDGGLLDELDKRLWA